MELLQIEIDIIESTAISQNKIINILYNCQARNETIIQWSVTSLIISSIYLLYYYEASYLKHIVDKINTDWYSQCILEESQLRSDLAINLLLSVFIKKENK